MGANDKKGKILFVDDEVDLQDIMNIFLNDLGYEVSLAGNGVEALQVLSKEEGFDLLISDINMPQMNGFDLLSQVKSKYPENDYLKIGRIMSALPPKADEIDYCHYGGC